VPLMTCRGSTFAGRVGASLLSALGLSELIAESLEEYEALALKLAREPEMLRGLRTKLARNRTAQPLFDTKRFTRNLEAAFVAMWQRHQRGEPPRVISIEESDVAVRS
jgi:protein O-GlcNAc transferase